jgi:hypothetical protein
MFKKLKIGQLVHYISDSGSEYVGEMCFINGAKILINILGKSWYNTLETVYKGSYADDNWPIQKIVNPKDLILYSHWERKTSRYWELLNEKN